MINSAKITKIHVSLFILLIITIGCNIKEIHKNNAVNEQKKEIIQEIHEVDDKQPSNVIEDKNHPLVYILKDMALERITVDSEENGRSPVLNMIVNDYKMKNTYAWMWVFVSSKSRVLGDVCFYFREVDKKWSVIDYGTCPDLPREYGFPKELWHFPE